MNRSTTILTTTWAACALLFAATGATALAQAPERPVLEVIATDGDGAGQHAEHDHRFAALVEEVPAGWVTVRLINDSDAVHLATIQRLPDGFGVEDQQAEVAPPFQRGMDLLNAGEVDAAMEAFGSLPAWFGDVVPMGGPGLTAPDATSEVVVNLESGTYMLECYVKSDGVFHSYDADADAAAMVYQFAVVDAASAAAEPKADVSLTLSSERGIEGASDLTPGSHTVAVHFEDQTVHENFLGHDVNLVRLEDDADLDRLAAWMDWSAPGGLEEPAPAEFLGGLQDMPAGETGYVTVNLEPGRYAWVAEVPNPDEKGMLQVFTVAEADASR